MDITSYVHHPGGLVIYPDRPCPGCLRATSEPGLCRDCKEVGERILQFEARRHDVALFRFPST